MNIQEVLKSNQDKRSRCIVYHRLVESFNIGKKAEHKQKVKFVESKNCLQFYKIYNNRLTRTLVLPNLVYKV